MAISKWALGVSLLAVTAAGASLTPTPAAAQAGEAAAQYDLPAQALADMLRTIARLSRREILFADAAVRGRQAPALRGRFTAEEAIRQALAGSGLAVETQGGALLVRAVPCAAIDEPAEESEDITVTGTRIRGAQGPSPVIVTTRRSLEEQGVADLTGFSRIIPQNFTGGQNPGVAGGGNQGGQNNINNATTLNLRGLGPTRR